MHIKSFQAWLKYTEEQEDRELNESPKAEDGDLEDYRVDDYDSKADAYDAIRTISQTVLNVNWEKLGDIYSANKDIYPVYRNRITDNVYAVCLPNHKESKEPNKIVVEITLRNENKVGTKMGLSDLHSIQEIIVIPKHRGDGLAKSLYKFFVFKLKYNLISDSEQYFGARRLWSRLSKDSDVIVDIVDINAGEFVEKGAVLHHGELNHEFDNRYWSKDESKEHIRFLLIDIK